MVKVLKFHVVYPTLPKNCIPFQVEKKKNGGCQHPSPNISLSRITNGQPIIIVNPVFSGHGPADRDIRRSYFAAINFHECDKARHFAGRISFAAAEWI